MGQREWNDILAGRRRGMVTAAVRGLLAGAAVPYACVTLLRRWAYRRGIVPSRRAGVPVVSVGNITVGGTGKTPMAAWVAGQLLRIGRRPAVVLRGYKAKGGRSDEAELLKELLAGGAGRAGAGSGVEQRQQEQWSVPVIVDADRMRGAEQAVGQGADVIVLDDGFQHLRLRRDLDIVLIDGTNPFGFGHVLPRGLLREPLSALKCADAIVITRSEAVAPAAIDALRQKLAALAPRASIHAAVHAPTRIIDQTGAELPLRSLPGRKVFAFCGIGNPGSFFAALERLGAVRASERAFDDHVRYGPAEIIAIARAAEQCGAEVLVTTQKDRVKLLPSAFHEPLWTLAVELQLTSGRHELVERIREALPGRRLEGRG
jgi:tetraacyldisaccharide 4'-kinase